SEHARLYGDLRRCGAARRMCLLGADWKPNTHWKHRPRNLAPGHLPYFGNGDRDPAGLYGGRKVVGSAQPNGFVVCHLPPGRHEVSVANFPVSFTPFSTGSERLTVNMRPGGTTYLAASPQTGFYTPGKITLMEVAESQGRGDTADL